MADKTIIEFLNEQARTAAAGEGHISFHMPGHKGRAVLYEKTGYGDFIHGITACDITEIPGADALFCPETTLRAVMDNYAGLYGVRHSELLVNGSSAGVMAAVIGSVPVGGKLILGRNSHHSAFSALRLGGINPVYVRPRTDPRSGLVGELGAAELKKACTDNPDADAVLITSPNYYGMMSDVAALAAIAHEYDMLLIVDQAHGAHLKFFDYDAERLIEAGEHIPFPKHSAESLGADIVINSTHKTLLSFTGSGILNICSDRVDIASVSDALRMLQTTSPSYLLMGSLDINERIMRDHGAALIGRWRDDLMKFYRRVQKIPGVDVVGVQAFETGEQVKAESSDADRTPVEKSAPADTASRFPMYHRRAGIDLTKINLSMASLGVSGATLDRELRHRGIISEMVHGDFVMLMTGIGNVSGDYGKVLEALLDISGNYGIVDRSAGRAAREPRAATEFELEVAGVPYEAESVPLYSADGRVLYDPVIVYPPGTPIACPGEILTPEALSFISEAIARGEKVTGVDDEGLVRVEASHG